MAVLAAIRPSKLSAALRIISCPPCNRRNDRNHPKLPEVTNTGFASERWPGEPGNSSIGYFDRPAGQNFVRSVLNRVRACNPANARTT